ncbi:MAG: hypothetical protein WD055_02075 [Candidatus Dependentiae bacterium]
MYKKIKAVLFCIIVAGINNNAQASSKNWMYAGLAATVATACYYTYQNYNQSLFSNYNRSLFGNFYTRAKQWIPSWPTSTVKNTDPGSIASTSSDGSSSDEETQDNTIKKVSLLQRTNSILIKRNSGREETISLQTNLLLQQSLRRSVTNLTKFEPNGIAGQLTDICLASIYEDNFNNNKIITFFNEHLELKNSDIHRWAKKFMKNNASVMSRIINAIEDNDYQKELIVLNPSRIRRLEKQVPENKNNHLFKRIKKEALDKRKELKQELEENINTIKDDVINEQGKLLTELTKNPAFKALAYTDKGKEPAADQS